MNIERERVAFLAMTGRRMGWMAAALIALVMAYAWFDGGEEPMRPIAEPIDVPGGAQ